MMHRLISISILVGLMGTGGQARGAEKSCARWFFKSARELRDIDAKVFPYFERIRRDPNWVAGRVERGELEAAQALEVFDRYRESSRWAQRVNLRIAQGLRSRPAAAKAQGLRGAGYRGYQWIRFWLPFLPDVPRKRARNIYESVLLGKREPFDRVWSALNASDQAFLERWNLKADFQRYVGDLQSGPRENWIRLSRIRRMGNRAVWGVLIPSIWVGALALSTVARADVQSLEHALDATSGEGMSKYDDAVELLVFEPLSTAGIRMGGHVYHFDWGHMARLRLSDLGRVLENGDTATSTSFFRIPIDLTDAQKAALRDRLESDVNGLYLFDGMDINSLSMAHQVLRSVGGPAVLPVLNRSAALSVAQLELQRLLGDSRIGRIRYVMENPRDANPLSLLGTSAIESSIYLLHAGRLVWLGPALDQAPLVWPAKRP